MVQEYTQSATRKPGSAVNDPSGPMSWGFFIGWSREQQYARLIHIADNQRFCVLPGGRASDPNRSGKQMPTPQLCR
jgi:hypothetical protein